jgi:hypothetical protein
MKHTERCAFASDCEQLGWRERLNTAVYYAGALSSRMCSTILCQKGINAFPILRTRRQIANALPSGTTPDTAPVLEVILKSMPIPDDQTAWQDIIEFRNDPKSMKKLKALRVWVQEFAQDGKTRSLADMKQKIEVLLEEYETHMKLHRMKVNRAIAATLLIAGKAIVDYLNQNWVVLAGDLAILPFILKDRTLSLTEAELKASTKELAYISMARSRFSR